MTPNNTTTNNRDAPSSSSSLISTRRRRAPAVSCSRQPPRWKKSNSIIITMPRLQLQLLALLLIAATSSSVAAASDPHASSSTVHMLSQSGRIESFDRMRNASSLYHTLFDSTTTETATLQRKQRIQERRARARAWLQSRPISAPQHVEPMSERQLQQLQTHSSQQQQRNLSWFNGGTSLTHSAYYLADPTEDYDKWAQAYRMLGGYIDCDHDKDGGGGSHDNNNNRNNGNEQSCSRWMLWAAYVNPNYQGNEYDEYYGDNPTSVLDCHNPDSDWILLGVYRQEFYQFIEQISKHVWAIDEYEYVVALAGLAYMTDEDCRQVGYDSSGNTLYAGVMPTAYGSFEVGLYTDEYCITPDTTSGKTYDDFGYQSGVDLGEKDGADDDGANSWAYDWWSDSQEYTLTQLNEVYEEFKYCTSCVDYPTYQDGYFIGDDGTDDDDLINQCWKFYSHDSFTCEAECISLAHAQGTILSVKYGDTTFGKAASGFYSGSSSTSAKVQYSAAKESPFQRLLANVALTASFLLFVATFLAFAVARRSRYRESSRSRRLLDDDDEGRSRRSSRRGSKSGTMTGDGVYRSSRSRSGARKSSSASRAGSKSRSSSANKSTSSRSRRDYQPPTAPRARSASRGQRYL